jgi:outer membrane protein assembly factor BamB
VTLGVSGTNAAAGRSYEAAAARHASLPGVVTSLQHPVRERWQLGSDGQVFGVAGLVVSTDRELGIVARESPSGRQAWSVEVGDRAVIGAIRCPHEVGDPATGSSAVVCLVPGSSEPLVPAAWRADVLDAATGAVLRRVSFPGFVVGSATLDGDLVVAERASGGVTVSRLDVVRDRELWRTHLPDLYAGNRLAVHADRDVVALSGAVGAVLDARDGREIGRWQPQPRSNRTVGPRVVTRAGEGFGVWASPFAGQWYGPDGRPQAELRGFAADPPVIDGSTPGVVLLGSPDGRRLTAVDVTSGESRWRRPMPDRVLLRLDGRVVTTRDGVIEAVDVADGHRLWSSRLDVGDDPSMGAPMTDGVRVLVPGRDADGRLRATAFDVSTGEREWRASLVGEGELTVLGDRLVSSAPSASAGADLVRVLG